MLAIIFLMFCGCMGDNYAKLASAVVEKNQLELNKTVLANRIGLSRECNITAKTVDALASFGYFSGIDNGDVIVLKSDFNATMELKNHLHFGVMKLYERGYKSEAKKLGAQMVSSNNVTPELLDAMALIYEIEGDYRGATLFYLDALNFKPNSERLNYAIARLYYLQKKPKQALRYAKKAYSLNGIEQKNIDNLITKIQKMSDGIEEPSE